MTNALYRCNVRIVLEGPFLMAGLGARAFGVDAAQIRDPSGHAIIPAGQVRGVLLQAVRDLQRVWTGSGVDAVALFGSAEGEDGSSVSRQGVLAVTDLTACAGGSASLTTTRVNINPFTGAAEEGQLFTLECPAAMGEQIPFAGCLHFHAASADAAARIAMCLDKAIRIIPAIGACKSVGYGTVVDASVADPEIEIDLSAFPDGSVAIGEKAALTVTLDRPLMVSPDLPESNVLRSSEVISGAVLKGALAHKLRLAGYDIEQPDFAAALSAFRVSQAVPYREGMRKAAEDDHLALSHKDGVARADAAEALALTGQDLGACPAFYHDAKAPPACDPDADADVGLVYDVRTRLAIDEASGAAEHGNLFTHVMVRHERVQWRFTAHMPDVETPASAIAWKSLLQGLFNVGKTSAVVNVIDVANVPSSHAVYGDTRFRVTLKSPLHMMRCPNLSGEAVFVDRVSQYWSEVTNGQAFIACEEVGEERHPLIFATQEIVGGYATASRRSFGNASYEPLVVLRTGSSFVLEASSVGNGLAATLTALQETGLPLPSDFQALASDHRRSVHTPANGYGAFVFERLE